MACHACYNKVTSPKSQKPPRFGITNGWAIGQIPYILEGGEIEEILAAAFAKIRVFANIYSYTAGAHKSIRGNHTFL